MKKEIRCRLWGDAVVGSILLLLFACSESDNVNSGGELACVDHKTTSITDDGSQLENFLEHVTYTPESLMNRAVGEWTGTFAGTDDIEGFSFSFTVQSYQQDGESVYKFYVPTDQPENWDLCASDGLNIETEIMLTSDSEFVGSFDAARTAFLQVDGAALADGSEFPSDIEGIPYIGVKLMNGESDDSGYYNTVYFAFPPDGKMYINFWKGDNSDSPNEAGTESGWVEADLETLR